MVLRLSIWRLAGAIKVALSRCPSPARVRIGWGETAVAELTFSRTAQPVGGLVALARKSRHSREACRATM